MKRFTAAIVIAVIGLLAVAASASAGNGQVFVTPGHGNQYQTYIFEGAGFEPEELVDVTFISPDGRQIPLYVGGVESYLIIQPDGTFALSMRPLDYLDGYPEGDWRAEFCPTRGEYCQVVEFVITL